jgi:8-oxo-dGTP pyrophosphatase MutT (NUDIX family)
MARELMEETGIVIEPAAFREHCVLSSAAHLLVFGMAPVVRSSDLPPFVATAETSERLVVTAPPDGIAFPLHAQVVQAFFERPPRHA